MNSNQTPKPSKKDKKPALFLNSEKLKCKQVLYASDLQHLLGLVFFPQQYTAWPDWCVIKKPGIIKTVMVLFCDRLGSIDCSEPAFTTLFGKPIDVCHPEVYQHSWDEEITQVPRINLSKHALEMAEKQQPITSPAPRRVWLGNKVAVEMNRLTKIAEEICKEGTAKPTSALETDQSRGAKRKADNANLPFPMPEPGSADAFDRTQLLLNLEQMVFEHVPLPPELEDRTKANTSGSGGFVASKSSYTAVSASSPMFAIDCEMVQTKIGSELARVTMVDELNSVVFDRLVRPEHPVEDYLTRFSGITRDMLEPVTTKLTDIQRELDELLPSDAILVGHSISNDLQAMRIYHPYLIDTSVIYNLKGARASKAKLRFLAEHFLGRMIQTGMSGHSSAEDAIATMDLVRLKLSNDLSFGDVTTSWRFPENYDLRLPSSKRRKVFPHQQSNSTNPNTPVPKPPDSWVRLRPDRVHPLFRLRCQELLSQYRLMGEPLHFFNRLLQDCAIPYSYWPSYNELTGTVEPDGDQVTPTVPNKDDSCASPNRISRPVLNWLLELAVRNRLVMANLHCPIDWDQQKCTRKVAKFCQRLYHGLQKPSLVVFVCTGDGVESFAPSLDLFHPSRWFSDSQQQPVPPQRLKQQATRKCYICLASDDSESAIDLD